MRLYQYYAVKELTKYDIPTVKIAEMTGLTSATVNAIQTNGELPEIFLLQCDDEKLAERCPICGATVFPPCYKCYQEKVGDEHLIEVIGRPEGHQAYMMNVHIFSKEK